MEDGQLWERLEAAAPLDWADALTVPPPGVDPESWSERALMQVDRRRTFFAHFAWGVPSRQAIAAIRAFTGERRLLEVCAGSGLWAKLLVDMGVDAIATDVAPRPNTQFVPVEALEAEAAVRAYRDRAVLLFCWPPFRNDCAFRALQAFGGDRVVFAGDPRFTADEQFHALLAQDWAESERLRLPSWPGFQDVICLYRS